MRRYPISSFLFWEADVDARDDVEAYKVSSLRERIRQPRADGSRDGQRPSYVRFGWSAAIDCITSRTSSIKSLLRETQILIWGEPWDETVFH